MNNIKDLFQKISYAQYPLMLIALYYCCVPYVQGFDTFWVSINQALIFAGLGVSFSTLQDTKKTQNNVSKKIWQDPVKGRLFLLMILATALVLLAVGLYGFMLAKSGVVKEVAFGALMLGISYLGLLKAAAEMHENHRVDKN